VVVVVEVEVLKFPLDRLEPMLLFQELGSEVAVVILIREEEEQEDSMQMVELAGLVVMVVMAALELVVVVAVLSGDYLHLLLEEMEEMEVLVK
jgi:hypothetical protein